MYHSLRRKYTQNVENKKLVKKKLNNVIAVEFANVDKLAYYC